MSEQQPDSLAWPDHTGVPVDDNAEPADAGHPEPDHYPYDEGGEL